MKTILEIDVSDLSRTIADFETRVDERTFRKVLRYTFGEVGRKVKMISKPIIQEKYKAKSTRIGAAFQSPQISTGSQISCIVPLKDPRGTIAKGKGAYHALKRGPAAKVLMERNSILPTSKGRKRIHFYIPSGRLAGHVFVRKEDGKVWRGVRRERDRETYQDSRGRNRSRRTGEVKEYGTRKRKGSIAHGVGIAVSQMPMNRSADRIQSKVLEYAGERFEHHASRALRGELK